MAVGNVELMHECSPQHLCMGTAGMKKGEKTEVKQKERKWKEVRQMHNYKILMVYLEIDLHANTN